MVKYVQYVLMDIDAAVEQVPLTNLLYPFLVPQTKLCTTL